MDFFEYGQVGVFGFVILIVLIGSLFQYLKVRSNNETIRTLAQSGQPIDPQLLRHLHSEESSSSVGLFVGGVITFAVAAALYLFGAQLGAATGDPEIGPVFRAIAIFPAFIGGGLLLAGIVLAVVRRGRRED